MIARLMVPVVGTVAALVVIFLAHEPRGKPLEIPAFDQDAPDHSLPEEEEEPWDMPEVPAEEEEMPEEPAAEPQELQLELAADGTFVDLEGRGTFASIDDLEQALGDARHKLVISNAAGVTQEALDAMIGKLRDRKLPDGGPRFQLFKVYRAPEAPPAEGR